MNRDRSITILGIESSCDDTSAAVLRGNRILSNYLASQKVHEQYGGVVPELASRAHQQNIVPVVEAALKSAGVELSGIDAIAVTAGPGLQGSLLVGTSFAKSLSLALKKPLIAVNHMEAHVLAHMIENNDYDEELKFPFLCLTVSGGHTQIVKVESPSTMKVIGETLDDAAGEAFDKAAKILGLPYPGGPLVDKYGSAGNPFFAEFPIPKIPGLNFSFSGIKTSFLYHIQEQEKLDSGYKEKFRDDLCASIQHAIVRFLLAKLKRASTEEKINRIAIAGGVSANSYLRKMLTEEALRQGWKTYFPQFEFCTDNAAMIAMAGFYKYQEGIFADMQMVPLSRWQLGN